MHISSNERGLLKFLGPYRIMITDASPILAKKVFGEVKTFGKVQVYGEKVEVTEVKENLETTK